MEENQSLSLTMLSHQYKKGTIQNLEPNQNQMSRMILIGHLVKQEKKKREKRDEEEPEVIMRFSDALYFRFCISKFEPLN